MSLIAFYGKQASGYVPTHILACTERHHIIDDKYAFVDLEIVFLLDRAADEVRLLCDRPLPLLSQVERTLRTNPAYRSAYFLDYLVNSGFTHLERVWDFQQTYEWGGENPNYNNRYRHSYNVTPQRPTFLLVRTQTHHPLTEISIAPLEHDPRLPINSGGNPAGSWQAEVIYQIRVGFFVQLPWATALGRMLARRYKIQIMSFSSDVRAVLESHQLTPGVQACDLWTKMSANKGLKPIVDAFSIGSDAGIDEVAGLIERELNVAHSDVWVLVPSNWNVYREPGGESFESTGHPRWILIDSRAGLRRFNAYHWLPGTSLTYSTHCYLTVVEDRELELILTPWWLDRRRLFPILISSVALGVSLFNVVRNLRGPANTDWAILAGVCTGLGVILLYICMEWLSAKFRLPD